MLNPPPTVAEVAAVVLPELTAEQLERLAASYEAWGAVCARGAAALRAGDADGFAATLEELEASGEATALEFQDVAGSLVSDGARLEAAILERRGTRRRKLPR